MLPPHGVWVTEAMAMPDEYLIVVLASITQTPSGGSNAANKPVGEVTQSSESRVHWIIIRKRRFVSSARRSIWAAT